MSGTSSQVSVLRESHLEGAHLLGRGKVRDIYDLGGGRLLLVATDRLSAFDVVLPQGIPDKGKVLTQTSVFWFRRLEFPNHLLGSRTADLPPNCAGEAGILRKRFMIVEKLDMLHVECVVRGYLAGSGWTDYRSTGTVSGVPLPPGLVESQRLPEPVFTPATKAESGHDENISFLEVVRLAGRERAEELREKSLSAYRQAAEIALSRGIILADTKFEWGLRPGTGELVLADEVLTPDSSRYWAADTYEPGKPQPALDKQFVRDYLLSTSWDRKPPAPDLPEEVVLETARRYREIYERLIGERWEG